MFCVDSVAVEGKSAKGRLLSAEVRRRIVIALTMSARSFFRYICSMELSRMANSRCKTLVSHHLLEGALAQTLLLFLPSFLWVW